jgi:hypothetical protein
MANALGIPVPMIPEDDCFYLQGIESQLTYENKRWIRLASLYPEKIDFVEFYRDGLFVDVAFEEPFYTLHRTTWIQDGIEMFNDNELWKAVVHLQNGNIIEKTTFLKQ